MPENFIDPISLMIADDDGFLNRQPPVAEHVRDVVQPISEIIAGDEGMIDRREMVITEPIFLVR